MGFKHVVFEGERYVDACFTGELTTDLVIEYLSKVWVKQPEIAGFSELLDMRQIVKVSMDTGQLAKIVNIGRMLDDASQKSKIALIVTDEHDVFKGSLYQTLQQLYPADNKQVELFRDKASARQWVLGIDGEI